MGTEELILFSCKKSLRQAKACRRDFLTVEGWICEIDVVLFAQTILGQAQPLAEAINLSKSPGTQCLQGFRGFFSGLKNVRTDPAFCLNSGEVSSKKPPCFPCQIQREIGDRSVLPVAALRESKGV